MNSIQEIEAALLQLPTSPTTDEDILARAKLMTKYFELVNARNAPTPPQPCNNIFAYPPPGVDLGVIETADGPIYAEVINGRRCFRLRSMTQLPRDTLAWQCENLKP